MMFIERNIIGNERGATKKFKLAMTRMKSKNESFSLLAWFNKVTLV